MPDVFYPLPVALVSEWPASAGRPHHQGTDFAVGVGTEARACFSGTVQFVGDDGLGALCIDLVRDDGLRARYGHLSEFRVSLGQRVEVGQVIALTGNTGMSTGPHLHWELRWDALWNGGAWVDPRTLGAQEFPPPKPKPKPKRLEGDTMIINIVGKAGVRSGGAWLFSGDRKKFLGAEVKGCPWISDEKQIKEIFAFFPKNG